MSLEVACAGARWHVPNDPTEVPIVIIHGASGLADDYAAAFSGLADMNRRSIVAPVFSEPEHRGYQSLRSFGRPLGAISVIDAALASITDRMDHPIGKVDLVGFSAGAQFAHRFAMLYPSRVRRLVLGAAGWYSYLDFDRPFPFGVVASDASGNATTNVDAFLRIPTLVLVGERDVARGKQLRTTDELDRDQGENRLVRGWRWCQHVASVAQARGLAPQARFEIMSRTGHSFQEAMLVGGFGKRALEFLSEGAHIFPEGEPRNGSMATAGNGS